MSSTDNKDFRKHHRQRVKDKVYENGFSGLTDYELLELALFYAIPYRDVKPLAHRLISEFGSLSRVFSADLALLEKVEGLGKSSALMIKTLSECAKRMIATDEFSGAVGQEQALLIARRLILGERDEHFGVILLDNSGKLIKAQVLFHGVVNEVEIINRKFLEVVLSHSASSVIIFHNHPYGSPQPSSQDIELTADLSVACRRIGVAMRDHLIVAGDQWTSLRNGELYTDLFD